MSSVYFKDSVKCFQLRSHAAKWFTTSAAWLICLSKMCVFCDSPVGFQGTPWCQRSSRAARLLRRRSISTSIICIKLNSRTKKWFMDYFTVFYRDPAGLMATKVNRGDPVLRYKTIYSFSMLQGYLISNKMWLTDYVVPGSKGIAWITRSAWKAWREGRKKKNHP